MPSKRLSLGILLCLTLAASIAFEQSYGGVDGDSASSTELYAILSSLTDVPLRQDIAVTGSVNQKGDVQPIDNQLVVVRTSKGRHRRRAGHSSRTEQGKCLLHHVIPPRPVQATAILLSLS